MQDGGKRERKVESEKVAGPYKSGDFKKGRSADQHLP